MGIWIIQNYYNLKIRRKIGISLQNIFLTKIPLKRPPNSIESIFVLAQEKLGDAILLFPFLKQFHEMFPNTIIDVGCTSYNKAIFQKIPFIRNCISYRPINFNFMRLIRKNKYTIFYNPKSGPSTTFHRIAKIVNADHKICLENNYHNHLYNFHLQNTDKKHIAHKYCELLTHYNPKIQIDNWLPSEFSEKSLVIGFDNYICFNLSAGSAHRKWEISKWKEIAKLILEQDQSLHIAIFCSKKDSLEARKIKSINKKRIHYPLDSSTIFHAARYIEKSKLLISVDTSLVHLAAALKIPVLGLYSNDKKNFARYSPLSSNAKTVNSKTRFIQDIEINSVIKPLNKLHIIKD